MIKYLIALVLIVGFASGAYLMNAKAEAKELKAPVAAGVIG